MNQPSSVLRLRQAVILVPLIALTLGSFWLYQVMNRATEDMLPKQQRSEPDFYVEKFSFVKMGEDGKAQYHFSGARLTHNPLDDSYDVTLPVLNNLGDGKGSTTIRAERASINSDYSRVQMFDNVQMDRPATANSEAFHAHSEYLLALPDDDVLETPDPVEITQGLAHLTGTGMHLNNSTREFSLASKVRGTYQAPRR